MTYVPRPISPDLCSETYVSRLVRLLPITVIRSVTTLYYKLVFNLGFQTLFVDKQTTATQPETMFYKPRTMCSQLVTNYRDYTCIPRYSSKINCLWLLDQPRLRNIILCIFAIFTFQRKTINMTIAMRFASLYIVRARTSTKPPLLDWYRHRMMMIQIKVVNQSTFTIIIV